jgi:sortase (surface protein transpeptidase)
VPFRDKKKQNKKKQKQKKTKKKKKQKKQKQKKNKKKTDSTEKCVCFLLIPLISFKFVLIELVESMKI